MGYRYLVLVGTRGRVDGAAPVEIEASLGAKGLSLRYAMDNLRVFASDETPTLLLPGGGIAIGHLFTRGGRPVRETTPLPALETIAQMRACLLEHYWGEYLLLQPEASGSRHLSVLRDPSGGIGCVYALNRGVGFLTSDVSLATDLGLYRKQIDWDFIAYFLSFSNHKTRRTGLAGVVELLPGCSLHLEDEALATMTSWSPWSFVAAPERIGDRREAASQLRNAVATAVRAWARTDQSVVLELSGGLDSSIVAACLGQTSAQVACCTLVTPVPGADERRYAGQVAAHLKFPLHSQTLTFEAARFDAPPPPHSVVPCVTALQYATDAAVQAFADAHSLSNFHSGGGGDTVFCYLSSATPAADAVRERGLIEGVTAVRNLTYLHECTFWKAARLTLRRLLKPPGPPSNPDLTFLNPANATLPLEAHPWFVAPAGALPGDRERIIGLAGTQIFRDGTSRGAKGFRRMPLLSQPVVEACLRIPTWMWIDAGRNRAVARTAFSGLLPQDILDRRSKGSFVSYSGAVLRRNKKRAGDFLLGGLLRAHDLLDVSALEAVLEDEALVDDDALQRVFDLCMVENWVRHQV